MHRPFRYTLLASSLWFLLRRAGAAGRRSAADAPPQQVEVTQPAGKLVLDHRLSLTLQGDDLGDALPRWRQRIELQTGWTLAPMEEANGAAIKVVIRIGGAAAAGKRRKLPAGGHAAGRHADRQHSLRRCAAWRPCCSYCRSTGKTPSCRWWISAMCRASRGAASCWIRRAISCRCRTFCASSTAWRRPSLTCSTGT